MKSHKDLTLYQTSINLVVDVYRISRNFPDAEKFGLMSQVRRTAVSIPSNIAEGAARISKKDFVRFLSIALGSLAETETQLEIASRLDFIKQDSAIDE